MANEGMQKAELFVELFYKHIRDGNIKYVTDMYEITFNKISEEYFKNEPWPHPSKLKHLVSDYLFWMLYNELYYRRMSSLGPRRPMGLELRRDMWDNYTSLFGVLATANAPLNLPNVWLWDMIDEFLYQFQYYRALAGQANTKPDVEFLRSNPDVWSPEQVREALETFVSQSGIRDELSADNGKKVFETAGFVGPSNVRRMLGYFSLVGLCRFHEVTGDHEGALRALSPLNPYNRQYLYTTCIPMANVNLYYYSGVAYLMLRRYMDAGRCFNTVLSFLLRVKGYLTKDHRYDLLLHKNEQLYKLLAITVALCPPVGRWCEEQVHEQLVHKCQDTMSRMNSGQADAYQRFFLEACPRYASPEGPDLEGETDTSMLGIQQQTQAFLKEVESTHQLPDLKRLLRLYTSISTTKLAQLLNTEPDRLVAVLHSIQARSMQKRWVAGEAISGEVVQTSDVHFSLEKDESGQDVVVVKERRAPANHLATLAKHIVRFEQITSDMETAARGAAAAPAVAAR